MLLWHYKRRTLPMFMLRQLYRDGTTAFVERAQLGHQQGQQKEETAAKQQSLPLHTCTHTHTCQHAHARYHASKELPLTCSTWHAVSGVRDATTASDASSKHVGSATTGACPGPPAAAPPP